MSIFLNKSFVALGWLFLFLSYNYANAGDISGMDAQRVITELNSSLFVETGKGEKVVYVLYSPNCPISKAAYEQAKANKFYGAKFRWISTQYNPGTAYTIENQVSNVLDVAFSGKATPSQNSNTKQLFDFNYSILKYATTAVQVDKRYIYFPTFIYESGNGVVHFDIRGNPADAAKYAVAHNDQGESFGRNIKRMQWYIEQKSAILNNIKQFPTRIVTKEMQSSIMPFEDMVGSDANGIVVQIKGTYDSKWLVADFNGELNFYYAPDVISSCSTPFEIQSKPSVPSFKVKDNDVVFHSCPSDDSPGTKLGQGGYAFKGLTSNGWAVVAPFQDKSAYAYIKLDSPNEIEDDGLGGLLNSLMK